jgi:hypothetical protein
MSTSISKYRPSISKLQFVPDIEAKPLMARIQMPGRDPMIYLSSSSTRSLDPWPITVAAAARDGSRLPVRRIGTTRLPPGVCPSLSHGRDRDRDSHGPEPGPRRDRRGHGQPEPRGFIRFCFAHLRRRSPRTGRARTRTAVTAAPTRMARQFPSQVVAYEALSEPEPPHLHRRVRVRLCSGQPPRTEVLSAPNLIRLNDLTCWARPVASRPGPQRPAGAW